MHGFIMSTYGTDTTEISLGVTDVCFFYTTRQPDSVCRLLLSREKIKNVLKNYEIINVFKSSKKICYQPPACLQLHDGCCVAHT